MTKNDQVEAFKKILVANLKRIQEFLKYPEAKNGARQQLTHWAVVAGQRRMRSQRRCMRVSLPRKPSGCVIATRIPAAGAQRVGAARALSACAPGRRPPGSSLDGGQVLGDDSRFGFLCLTAPSSLAPFADNSSRRRRRGWRWRRGLIDDRLRRRWGGLRGTPRDERRGNHDGNYRRTTQQPVARHFFGNVDHPFLHG